MVAGCVGQEGPLGDGAGPFVDEAVDELIAEAAHAGAVGARIEERDPEVALAVEGSLLGIEAFADLLLDVVCRGHALAGCDGKAV